MRGTGWTIAFLAVVVLLASERSAQAIPSFAAQTGQPCTACHIGGYGPQLTPLGRAFKIGGYTQSGGSGVRSQIPLSAMIFGSYTNTQEGVPPDQRTHHYGSNGNFALDQISGFVAGRVTDFAGGFVQFTYSNIPNASHLDNTDLRPYTTTFDLGDRELRVGISLNNTPTVQDPYNTTFAWGFPYIASGLAPTPAAQPVLAGAFAGSTLGYSVYGWYDKKLYLEIGAYNTMSPYLLARTGNFFTVGSSQGMMPYIRAAYEWNWSQQSAHVGALYLQSNVNPATAGRITDGSFGRDHYRDYAFDASYEYLGTGTHIVTVQGIYTHENQDLTGSSSSANAANGTDFGNHYSLNQIRLNASYWFQNTYGFTAGWQKTWGPANPVLFSPGELTGSNNSKPNSNSFIFEADWVPFGKADSWKSPLANLKLGLQYIVYTQFNGAGNNYDGFGRNAAGNNTLYAFAWLAF
ncbi:hypothetical protein [Limobrevibacterium gyesilva]|uniref:Cytochrome C n=1 Tax=Limobrevibacterium gyesilva TaxID=2991712 RepID=A0AA41YLN9_9PROT|nr:hypothetical protein [Limobrevibacterium gyesilva]MCW3474562.1 hypothetical protein [Limobrevibacterium gyesilva]